MIITEYLNIEQQALASKLIHLEILQADGQAYEDLFVRVQQGIDSSFRPIKPQGAKGDKKNDGFSSSGGRYYQVYGPELQRTEALLSKLSGIFPEIKEYWDSIASVKEFKYVINDKFKGTFPDVERALAKIKEDYDLDVSEPYLSKDLKTDFFRLPAYQAIEIVGSLPESASLEDLDFEIMGEVITHIMKSPLLIKPVEDYRLVEFQNKMKFNLFSEQICILLKSASYTSGAVTNFFEQGVEFSQSVVKNHVISEYLRIVDSENSTDSDVTFFALLDSLCPRDEKAVQDATLAIIAFFFEACDIFEKPV